MFTKGANVAFANILDYGNESKRFIGSSMRGFLKENFPTMIDRNFKDGVFCGCLEVKAAFLSRFRLRVRLSRGRNSACL